MQVFVTVGSTLFQNLTDVVLSQEIVQTFVRLGYNRLIVQYGSGTIPRNVSESQGNIHIETIDYIKDIDTIMEESDLIISHAGSGSILSGLRMGKKMVIVPNTKLMDNHQVELAEALNQDGYLLVSSPSALIYTLSNDLPIKVFTPFPPFKPERFRKIVDDMFA